MKRLLGLLSLLLILSGCQSGVDISPYLSVAIDQPELTADYSITPMTYSVIFDQEKFLADNPAIPETADLNSLFEQLQFTVDGQPIEQAKIESAVKIELSNKEVLKDTGLRYKSKLSYDPSSTDGAEDLATYNKQVDALEEQKSHIKAMEVYVEAANELYDLFKEYDVDFYVSEQVFGPLQDFYQITPEIYQTTDQRMDYTGNQDVYFVVERKVENSDDENENQTYTWLIDSQFEIIVTYIEMTAAFEAMYSVDGVNTQRVFQSFSVHEPITYKKTPNGNTLYYNDHEYLGSSMVDAVIADVTVEASDAEGKHIMTDFNYIYEEVSGETGRTWEEELTGPADEITIDDWMDVQLNEIHPDDMSYQTGEMLVYGILYNSYNASTLVANGHFDLEQ